MTKKKMYRYLGRNGILTTYILLDGITHIPMFELKAKDGYILTNNHVVSYDYSFNNHKIIVEDYFNNKYDGEVIDKSSKYDLAVVRINKKVELKKDQEFTFSSDYDLIGNESIVGLTYPDLAKFVNKPGTIILADDGKVITKIKDVDNAIKDIIGIDRDQFRQIAMIAQGDFLKLLIAPTKERMEIFRHIFKTETYQNMQERLKRESGKLSDECDAIRRSISQYINGIVCDDDNTDSIEVTKAKNGDITIEDTLTLLEKLISDDEKTEQAIEKNKENLQKII